MKYEARIFFESVEDDYKDGEINGPANFWTDTLTAETKEELKQKIEEITNSKWENIEQEDLNEYPNDTEYWTSYLANADGFLASDQEMESWKQGKLKLWAVNCHILVSQVSRAKVTL